MRIWDILLIIGLAAAVFFAARSGKKQLKNGCGGCRGGNCTSCPFGAAKQAKQDTERS